MSEGVRSFSAFWMGGAASTEPPPPVTPSVRSFAAFWMGGAALLGVAVEPPTQEDQLPGAYGKTKRKKRTLPTSEEIYRRLVQPESAEIEGERPVLPAIAEFATEVEQEIAYLLRRQQTDAIVLKGERLAAMARLEADLQAARKARMEVEEEAIVFAMMALVMLDEDL